MRNKEYMRAAVKPAVFLDRDGVLNRVVLSGGRPRAPLRLEDFEVVRDAPAAVQTLLDAGFLAIGVTNQPELASGELPAATLAEMHRRLLADVPLTALYVCPHRAWEGCACHKPEPGLLERAAAERGVDLTASFLIGDRWRDIEAGNRAGCTTVLIERPYSGDCRPVHRVGDLASAVSWVLGRRGW